MVSAALAVAAGNWLGNGWPALRPWLLPATALAAGLLLARAWRRAPGARPLAPGLGLVLLACAAAWRASAGAPGPGPAAPRQEEEVLPGPSADPPRARAPTWVEAEGPIELEFDGESTRAWVGGVRLAGEGRLARDGERVRALSAEPPVPAPRAPPPAPAGSATLEVLPDQVVRLAPGPPPRGDGWRRLRERWLARLRALPSDAARSLAPAVLLGDQAGVGAATNDLFTRTGTRHLLAVSGLHVALLALFVALPFGAAARFCRGSGGRWIEPLPGLLLLLYVPLAGGGSPVQRAALCFALARCAPLLPAAGGARGRRVDGLSLLGLAFLLEGLGDPRSVGSVGVQLSYAATLGLVLCTPQAVRALAGAFGRDPRPGPRRAGRPPGWPALLGARAARAVLLGAAASLTASIATLPIVWARFGEWSPVGILLTPLVLPLVAWLLAAAAAHALGLVPAGLVGAPAELLIGALELADGLPGTPAPLPARPGPVLGAVALLTLWAAVRPGGAPTRAAALGWAVLVIPWTPSPAGLEVAALDVGHGTAVVLRAPGLGTWVFDAGSRDRRGVARRALGPWLAHWEATRPTVVLSHADRDHASALDWLIERYPPALWLGALPAPLRERLAHTCEWLDLPAGELGLEGGPVGVRLLRGLRQEGNEGSRALELAAPDGRVLLLGDAEGAGLRALLRTNHLQGPTRLLLAPHHGSDSPWLGPLLEATRPAQVWISSPVAPPIGPELDRRGIPWRSTGRDGPLLLTGP